jgi:hypothetical protein
MGLNSTPFLSYHDIDVKNIDLFEDAWNLNSCYNDVLSVLSHLEPVSDSCITYRLLKIIRSKD